MKQFYPQNKSTPWSNLSHPIYDAYNSIFYSPSHNAFRNLGMYEEILDLITVFEPLYADECSPDKSQEYYEEAWKTQQKRLFQSKFNIALDLGKSEMAAASLFDYQRCAPKDVNTIQQMAERLEYLSKADKPALDSLATKKKKDQQRAALARPQVMALVNAISISFSNAPKTVCEADSIWYTLKTDHLFECAKKNDLDGCKQYISITGGDLNATLMGNTALSIAAEKGYVDFAKLLLDAGADVNGNPSALYYALEGYYTSKATGNYVEMIHLLINAGADIPNDALRRASSYDHTDLVRILIDAGADVNANRPLHAAVCYAVKCRTESPFLSYYDDNGKLKRYLDCEAGFDNVKLLVNAGSNVNAVDEYNATPLIWILKMSDKRDRPGHSTDIAKYLIDAGADVNIKARSKHNEELTALYMALENGDTDLAKLLIVAGADPNQGSGAEGHKVLPLVQATKVDWGKGSIDVVKLLIEAGADVNAVDQTGQTALTASGGYDVIKHLVAAGADLSKCSYRTLCISLREGDIDLAKNLISAGVEINPAIADYNETPLFCAIRSGNPKLLELLISAGVNVKPIGAKESPPVVLAAVNTGDTNMVALLISAGADVNIDYRGYSPLRAASGDMVKLLTDAGATLSKSKLQE